METLYSSLEELHCSSSGADLSERVQSMARGVYNEFEIMMSTYGEGVIKDLMPQVVAILESLNQAYRDKQEHEVELELLRVELDNLKVQFDREKQLRKASEQKYLAAEDVLEEERKVNRQKTELSESSIRALQVKIRNIQELLSRHEEREREMKDEYSKLHNKYNELFRNHVDFVERAKMQQSDSPLRTKVSTPASVASGLEESTLMTTNTPLTVKNSKPKMCNNQINGEKDDAKELNSNSVLSQSLADNVWDNDIQNSVNQESGSLLQPAVEDSCQYNADADNLIAPSSSTGDICDSSADNLTEYSRYTTSGIAAKSEAEQATAWLPDDEIADGKTINRVSDVLSVDIMSDDALVQNCFSSPYGVGISSLRLAEFDDYGDNPETKSLPELEGNSVAGINVSLYDELSKHDAAVLGEMDSGADLTTTGVSAAVENLILENKELLATKNALNVVKDDLIAQLDELNGEIDLLKEENVRLQQVVEEREARVSELEMELKKLKETTSEKQSNGANDSEQSHITRIDLMRVLIERNQYKERLMELQEAIRRADMARAAAKESQEVSSKPVKKRSTVWGFFSGLLSSDDTTSPSKAAII